MADQSKGRDAAIDDLYALPLDDFTAARDDLAGRLRREGDGDAAAEVKRLRKPSVAAWAVNQASRRSAKRTAELVKAGEALREAQRSLSGSGARAALQAARQRERELVHELGLEAERALRDAGRPVSAAVREQIDETLHAAAVDAGLGELVGSGRLERASVAVGFPDIGPAAAGTPARADKGRRKRDARQTRLARERDRLAEATRKREAAEASLREAERAAREAAKDLDRATRRVRAEGLKESELGERVEELREELEAAP
jgi:hypothetical protein